MPLTGPLMSLGMFVFELKTLPYNTMQQQLGWKFPENSRVGVRPAMQFTGPDGESVTLAGVLHPEISGGEPDLQELRDLADEGEAQPLIDGTGKVYGMFVIVSLNLTRTAFFPDGAARKIEFSIQLKRADDKPGQLAQDKRQ